MAIPNDSHIGKPEGISCMCLAGLSFAYILTGNHRYVEIGLKILNAGLPQIGSPFKGEGKDYSMMLRNSPRFIHLLEKLGIGESKDSKYWPEEGV